MDLGFTVWHQGITNVYMGTLSYLFGSGKELTVLQMCMRAFLIFIVCLLLIRLSGRRSFGMHMPFDNVIAILLGALLSRPIVGASELLPTILSSGVIVALHRLFAWIALRSHTFGKLIKGEALIVYEEGKFNEKNMARSLVSKKDINENIRLENGSDTMDDIKSIYVERSGKISIIKKEKNL